MSSEVKMMGSAKMSLRVSYWFVASAVSLAAAAHGSRYAAAGEKEIAQTEKDCLAWQSHIKPGQVLTDDMRTGAGIVPLNGAMIANYVSGRRTIWMAPNDRVKYATCG